MVVVELHIVVVGRLRIQVCGHRKHSVQSGSRGYLKYHGRAVDHEVGECVFQIYTRVDVGTVREVIAFVEAQELAFAQTRLDPYGVVA